MKRKIVAGRQAQAGVSLVELMVGLTIGLIITAGAFSILFSNQKLILEKDVMDRSQENFRFAATTITRLVRQANELGVPTNNNELIVTFDRMQRDCLGQVNNSWINTFKVNENHELLCILNNDENLSYVLAKDIAEIKFAYGIQGGVNTSSLVYEPRFTGAGTTANPLVVNAWNTITSVLTQITVSEGNGKQPTVDFISTSHLLALTKLASSGGTSHANPSNNTGNGTTVPPVTNPPVVTDPPVSTDPSVTNPPVVTDPQVSTCPSDGLNHITLNTAAGSIYTWGSVSTQLNAQKGTSITISVNNIADLSHWSIAKNTASFQPLTSGMRFDLPDTENAIMQLTLKCGTSINSSITFKTTI